jgi:uncharacterized protein YjbJ (UPF0337 family)
MNKDRVEGKVKDITGRAERQAGEWTDDAKKQAHGAVKQVEGKLQNVWGKAKDVGRKSSDQARTREAHRTDDTVEIEEEREIRRERKAS